MATEAKEKRKEKAGHKYKIYINKYILLTSSIKTVT